MKIIKIIKNLGWFMFWMISVILGVILFLSVAFYLPMGQEYDTEYITKEFCSTYNNDSYTTEDKETDMILDFFSGRKDLPDSIKAKLVKKDSIAYIRVIMEYALLDSVKADYKSKLERLDNISESEFLSELYLSGYDFEKKFRYQSEIDSIENREVFSAGVWNLYYATGAPKIRYDVDETKWAFRYGAHAYYDPFTNTIWLRKLYDESQVNMYSWTSEYLLCDLCHAVQFRQQPVVNSIRASAGIVHTLELYLYRRVMYSLKQSFFFIECACFPKSHAMRLQGYQEMINHLNYEDDDTGDIYMSGFGRSLSFFYDKLYSIPGTLEYEAHSILEPKIRSEYEVFLTSIYSGY